MVQKIPNKFIEELRVRTLTVDESQQSNVVTALTSVDTPIVQNPGAGAAAPLLIPEYTITPDTTPDPTQWQGHLIIVTDAIVGYSLCVSNGTNWINVATHLAVA